MTSDQVQITLTVNGATVALVAHPDAPLLTLLRESLGLSGPRFGCGLGQCGACFVLMDDQVVPACDTPAWSADLRSVVTVEGLASADELHPVQQAILDEQAAQCGFCISGIAVSAAALLADDPDPDEGAIRAALDRNLCRCGVHGRVVRAVQRAAGATR